MAVEQTNDVQVEQRQPQPVLIIRETIPVAQLGEAMGDRLGAIWAYLRQSGAQPAGPPFVRYHTFGESDTDMETGVPVVEPMAGESRVQAGELPGGSVVSTSHLGEHRRLGEAYGRIAAWMKESGHEPVGPTWEVYHWIDHTRDLDPSSWGDPPGLPTELVQPFR